MNLRGKSENKSAVAVLADKTNIKSTRASKKVKQPIKTAQETSNVTIKKPRKKLSKENNENFPLKAVNKMRIDVSRKKRDVVECEASTPGSPYCFGFSESDDDVPPCPTELTKFDNSKPYRLALYVKPSRTIRLNPIIVQKILDLNPTLNLTYNDSVVEASKIRPMEKTLPVKSPDRTKWKAPLSSTPKPKAVTVKSKGKMVQKKITEVFQPSPKRTRTCNTDKQFTSFFDVSSTSEEEEKMGPPLKIPKRSEPNYRSEDSSADEIKPVHYKKPSRRSYSKKPRPDPEPEEKEVSSDEILKSIERSRRKAKTKKKAASKAEEEFERWSRSINSEFSEVEQFNLSVD